MQLQANGTITNGFAPSIAPVTPDQQREAMLAQIAALTAANEALRAAKAKTPKRGRSIGFKVGPKGGVSVYGLGRFPVTLFKEQWIALFEIVPDIQAFILEHEAELKAKPAK